MQILSHATEQFLAPIPKHQLGNAILEVSLPEKAGSLLLSIYEIDSEGTLVAPSSIHAQNFVRRRFKHGYTPRSSHGQLYETYEVPATDYSVYLILHTWTAKRILLDNVKQFFSDFIIEETRLSQCTERTARYKTALHPLLVKFKEDSDAALFDDSITPIPPETTLSQDSSFISSLNLNPFVQQDKYACLTLYQKVAASNAISLKAYSYFMKPGCGKTAPAIVTADYVASLTAATSHRPARILILTPKNIRYNWQAEFQHFSHQQHKISILTGNCEDARTFALIEALLDNTSAPAEVLSKNTPIRENVGSPPTSQQNTSGVVRNTNIPPAPRSSVVICNYEAAVNTALTLKIEWDLVIIDESHSIANTNTKRTKYMMQLRNNSAKRLILTGTPIRNLPFDLYPQFEFLGKGVSGFSSHAKFKDFFGVYSYSASKSFKTLDSLQNIPLLQERLCKYAFLLNLEEAIPALPDSTEDILECTLSPEQLKVYRDVALKLQAYLSNADQKINDMMIVKSHLVKLLRLAEITSGYAATEDSGIYRFDPNPKLELLVSEIRSFLEDNPHAKVQIWAHFQENIRQIAYRFNSVEGIKSVSFYGETKDSARREAEQQFNCDPQTKIFVGSPTAGGVGLNLLGFDPYNPHKYKTNCEWAIFYSQNWSSVSRLQAMARAKRKGTRIHMRYTDLVVPGSIDMMIRERVRDKIQMSLTIQDLRKILEESLKPVTNGD